MDDWLIYGWLIVRDCLVIFAAIPTMIRDNIQETGDAEKKNVQFCYWVFQLDFDGGITILGTS